MERGYDAWANPSSPHAEGRKARALLEEARTTLAEVLGWRHDVIFTSGASEAIEIAAARARIPGRAHGATEHAIVPACDGRGRRRIIPVGRDGLIDEAALDAVLAEGPALVAIQQVNNETGIIQPLDRLAPKIREAGSLLLADCAQSAGKIAAARRRLHRPVGAQARRAAGGRRVAGQGSRRRSSRSAGRRRAIAAARRTRRARWPSPPRLRPGPMTWSGWQRFAPGSRRA